MDYELHYIIVEGTNLRIGPSGTNVGIPTVYDTLETAQHTIEDGNEERKQIDKLMERVPSAGRTLVPMSVVEYNLKYRNIDKSTGE